jgi:endonuclease I
MKKLSLFFISFLLLFVAIAQIPPNYYNAAEGKKQLALKTALSQIITTGHTTNTYASLWTHFQITDKQPNGKVWDMYSDCNFTFVSNQCGNYKSICDCYNREHSVPASWFNDEYPMYADLFHLYPTDGKVNNYRGNYPFGETNGICYSISKVGSCTFPGYSGTVFEPSDEYKGDFARTYFYMATRYENQISKWESPMLTGKDNPVFTTWATNLLLKWHRNDPVSQKELDRNNAVYGIQYNRNPFIDYPEMVEHIWGNLQDVAWNSEVGITQNKPSLSITITKCNGGFFIEGVAPNSKVEIYSVVGQNVYTTSFNQNFISLDHLKRGVYIVKINDYIKKIVW